MWKLHFGRPTPSIAMCLRSCVCLGGSFQAIVARRCRNLTHWLISYTGHSTPFICARNYVISPSKNNDGRPAGGAFRRCLTGLYLWATAGGIPRRRRRRSSYLPKCLAPSTAPPRWRRSPRRPRPYERPRRRAAAAGGRARAAPATALPRDDEATAPPPPEAVEDLRDELAETERRLARAFETSKIWSAKSSPGATTSWRAYRRRGRQGGRALGDRRRRPCRCSCASAASSSRREAQGP